MNSKQLDQKVFQSAFNCRENRVLSRSSEIECDEWEREWTCFFFCFRVCCMSHVWKLCDDRCQREKKRSFLFVEFPKIIFVILSVNWCVRVWMCLVWNWLCKGYFWFKSYVFISVLVQKKEPQMILWWINTQPILSSLVLALKIDNSSRAEERTNRSNNWSYKVFNNCNRKTYRETKKQPVYIVFNQRQKTREKNEENC